LNWNQNETKRVREKKFPEQRKQENGTEQNETNTHKFSPIPVYMRVKSEQTGIKVKRYQVINVNKTEKNKIKPKAENN